MKNIAILGITGSIGLSAVNVIKNHSDKFRIVLASAHSNYQKLFSLAAEFSIPKIVITDKNLQQKITESLPHTQIFWGEDNLTELLSDSECDLVLNAISGSAGLQFSMQTVSAGIDLALANKESLVMAGHLISQELQRSKSLLLPVDSEHSAIFQAIGSTPLSEIKSLIITASGGPFRKIPLSEFENISVENALAHPNWKMGKKVTIDSATMMNKGLEVIEAHWLFQKDFSHIKAVIHPQSIIHSLVEFADGSLLAQLSFPSMQLPILFAFSYPHHIDSELVKTDIFKLPELSFHKIEKSRYPLFFLACEVGKSGGLLPTIMNAANEAAVELFLNKKINFTEINTLVQNVVERENNLSSPDLETIIRTNKEIWEKVLSSYRELI